MRQNIAEGFLLKDNKHPFVFENPEGHVFKIIIVSSQVLRVQYLTPEEAKSNHDSHINASVLNSEHQVTMKAENEQTLEISTSKIRLVVTLKPSFHLSWYSNESEIPFAQDLAYRSYGYDKSTSDKWHYQRRFEDNLYYGLGERAGSLDLSGRRFRLERLDCMGYDAETSDPLYKFCPFYINLSSTSKEAYGLYYNNFSRTNLDLGQELDAVSKKKIESNNMITSSKYVFLFNRCGDLIHIIIVNLAFWIII